MVNSTGYPFVGARPTSLQGNQAGLVATPPLPAPRPHRSPKKWGKRNEKTQAKYDRLDTVNGVVTPSKLAPDQAPIMRPSRANAGTPLRYVCPLCTARFANSWHVKSHFPGCVGRNGNPDGLRWDHEVGGEDVGESSREESSRPRRRGRRRSRSRSP